MDKRINECVNAWKNQSKDKNFVSIFFSALISWSEFNS